MKAQTKTSSKVQVATMTATALILAASFFAAMGVKTDYSMSKKKASTAAGYSTTGYGSSGYGSSGYSSPGYTGSGYTSSGYVGTGYTSPGYTP